MKYPTELEEKLGYKQLTTTERRAFRQSHLDPLPRLPNWESKASIQTYLTAILDNQKQIDEKAPELRRANERARDRRAKYSAKLLWSQWHSLRTMRGLNASLIRSAKLMGRDAE